MICITCKKNLTQASEIRNCTFRFPCPAREHLPSEEDTVFEDLGLILLGSAALAAHFTDETPDADNGICLTKTDSIEPGGGEFGGGGASDKWDEPLASAGSMDLADEPSAAQDASTDA